MDARLQDLFDRHITGQLTGAERLELNELLGAQPGFRKEFEELEATHEELRQYATRKTLVDKLRSWHRQMPPVHLRAWRQDRRLLRMRWATTAAVAACISVVAVFSTLAAFDLLHTPGRERDYQQLSEEVRDISSKQEDFHSELRSYLENQDGDPKTSYLKGTGFLVHETGYLLTAGHLVRDARQVIVDCQTDTLPRLRAKVVKYWPEFDLALLQINDERFSPVPGRIPYGFSSREPRLGEAIYTLGFPKSGLVYSEGSLSSLTGFENDTVALQTSIPANPGNSGGPLFNERGQVVGMLSGKSRTAEASSYAINGRFILAEIASYVAENDSLPLTVLTTSRSLPGRAVDQIEKIRPYIYQITALN